MRDSTMFYRTQCDALRGLPPEQFKAAVTAIWDYELDGKAPDGDPVTVMAVGMAKPLIDKRAVNYENGKRGGRPKEEKPDDNRNEPNDNRIEPNDNRNEPNDNRNEPKGERIKDKGETEKDIKTRGRFTPPTIQELDAYITEHGYHVDAEKFLDYYNSNGWMVGKNHMKDWKAAVRNWSRNQRQGTTANGAQGMTVKTTKFSNFPERRYDYDDLEGQLLAAQGGANGS